MSVTDHEMPAVPADEAVDEAAMQDWAELLVERVRSEGVELGGIEPPSAGRCLTVIRPFPVCGVDGSCVAGSGGPR